jgi:DNA-binding CsgD family transcriptional regulator
MEKESINKYLLSVKNKLSYREVVPKSLNDIANFPLPIGKCVYILDFKEKTVPFQKNIEETLGYTTEEFTFDLAVNFFHPDDYDIVTRLIKATLIFATEHNVTRDVGFCLCYRARHKNGHYIKVLRQSTIFAHDPEGKIISNLSMLTDISFLNTSHRVEWRFDAPGLDREKFRKYVQQQYADFFSERELDIIRLLRQGLKSEEIASKLHISKNTVDTHRRNMLKKAHCQNSIELLNFCSQHGLG